MPCPAHLLLRGLCTASCFLNYVERFAHDRTLQLQLACFACCALHDAGNDEVYIEVVQGFGETLVGNCPGQALQATVSKQALQELGSNPDAVIGVSSATRRQNAADQAVTIRAYPSKSVALTLPSSSTSNLDTSAFIFRSDSNGEDLQG